MKAMNQLLNVTEVNLQNTIDILGDINQEEEYVKDDDIYCKKCHTPRTCMGFNRKVRCICKCQAEIRDRENEIERQKEKQRIVDKIKSTSLLGEKYKNVSFENTETKHSQNFELVFNRCKKYCEVANKVLKDGIGIYLFGEKGTGKSRLTACMANELMNNYYTVLYTNFAEISKYIRNTFKNSNDTEYNFIEKLTSIDFLFIDDFGTELVSKNDKDLWLQEQVFQVINKRYNNNKPIIFTSNYSLRQLFEERGVADKTIDRIQEICEIMKLEGTSYRREAKKQKEILF